MTDQTDQSSPEAANWRLVFFAFICVFISSFGQSFFISIFNDRWLEAFDVSKTQLGFFYSCATLASAISIFFLGPLIDRVNYTIYTAVVAVGLCLAAALVASSQNIVWLGFGFFALRLCGQGLFGHIASTVVAKAFSKIRGRALAISGLGIPAGEAFLPFLFLSCLTDLNWQQQWQVVGVTVAVIVFPILLWLNKPLKQSFEASRALDPNEAKISAVSRKDLLADWRIYFTLPAAIAVPFTMTAYFFFQKLMFKDMSWSEDFISYAFPIYAVTSVVSSLNSGHLVDKFTARKVLPWMLIPLSIGLLLIATIPSPYTILISVGLFGLSSGACRIVLNSFWAEVYGIQALGAIRSLLISFLIISTAMAPTAVALSLDYGLGYQWLYAVFTGAVVLASVLSAIPKFESNGNNPDTDS